VSVSRISLAYGISVDSLRRHSLAHAGPALRAALAAREGLAVTDLVARVLAVADDALEIRRQALEAGRFRDATRAGDSEVRALAVVTARFGIDDADVLDLLRAAEKLTIAVGRATRAQPEFGQAVAAQLRALGALDDAEDIERIVANTRQELTA
jgi:hypothetical protein